MVDSRRCIVGCMESGISEPYTNSVVYIRQQGVGTFLGRQINYDSNDRDQIRRLVAMVLQARQVLITKVLVDGPGKPARDVMASSGF